MYLYIFNQWCRFCRNINAFFHKQVLHQGLVLSYLHGNTLGHHWWGLYSGSEMLFSRVFCQVPWTTAPLGALGNIFFVWAHSSLPDSGSVASTSRPAAPPEASTGARLHPDRHPEMQVCSLYRGGKCVSSLVSATICINAEQENGTDIFFPSRLFFLFPKGITSLYFYTKSLL